MILSIILLPMERTKVLEQKNADKLSEPSQKTVEFDKIPTKILAKTKQPRTKLTILLAIKL